MSNREFIRVYVINAGFAKAGHSPFHRFRHSRRSSKAAADSIGEPPKIFGLRRSAQGISDYPWRRLRASR
jgi:hypothetical protein